jgi:hypothetical protein
MSIRITRSSALLGGVILAAASPAQALSTAHAERLLNDKFFISAGGFLVGTDIKAEVDGRAGQNQEIDFERDLGLDNDATRVRIDGLWRITPTHRLRFMYFDTENEGSRQLDRTITWGDYSFAVGAQVSAETRVRVAELANEYAFTRTTTYEVEGTIGIHYIDTELKLSGVAGFTDSNGVVQAAQSVTRESNAPAPLPVIGLRAGWVVAPQFYVDAQAQFFKVKPDEYDGTLTNLRLAGTWMFSRNFGVGLGYDYFGTDVEVERTGFNGNMQVDYSGLQLFITGTF